MHPFDNLQRSWWFPNLAGYRSMDERGTYNEFDLDSQPELSGLVGDLAWLRHLDEPQQWCITQEGDGDHINMLDIAQLARVGADRDMVDPAMLVFLAKPALQRAIRSCTGCVLELGDCAVSLTGSEDLLVHFLSDQQWTKHWLVCCSKGPRRGVVLAADVPYGFRDVTWGEEQVSTDLTLTTNRGLTVVADSFEEFLQRYWIENEIFFADPGRVENKIIADYQNRLTKN